MHIYPESLSDHEFLNTTGFLNENMISQQWIKIDENKFNIIPNYVR